MSLKEKFEERIGLPLEFRTEDYPDYIITLGPSHILALIDIDKFNKEVEWKPFIVKNLPEEGDLYFEDECFKISLIKKAMNTLNPKQYGLYKDYDRENDMNTHILVLKRANRGILIPPAYPKDDEVKKIYLKDHIKEPPKSVFAL